MKRRDILCFSACITASCIPVVGLARAMSETIEDALAEIGRTAIAEGVVPADRNALRRELGLATDDVAPLAGELNGRVAADFAAGDSVLVAGWVLSRTEACICALVALGGRAS